MDKTLEGLIAHVTQLDVEGILVAEKEYNSSWRKYGGFSAFMNLDRKWSRIVTAVKANPDKNIFTLVKDDLRAEGIIDDMRDLRRYLILVEAEIHRPESELAEAYIKNIAQEDVVNIMMEKPPYIAAFERDALFDHLEAHWHVIERSVLGNHKKFDIFSTIKNNQQVMLKEMCYLRRYLILIESYLLFEGVNLGIARDNHVA